MERTPIHSATRKDFRVDWFSGRGAGGQYRNKHQNCVRITHIKTGITTTGQEARDRPTNFRVAFRKMADLLVKHWLGEDRRARWPGNPETIRAYHGVDNRVLDKASGLRQTYSEVVGAGNLGAMIDARRLAMLTEQ